MAIDTTLLEKKLCDRLCTKVRIHRRDDGELMLDTPFTYPDGDHFPIYLTETQTGGVVLSDRGHTLMHMSYEHDIDTLYDGTRSVLREQIVLENGIQEDEGVFWAETSPDQIADTLFRFGQTLSKIYDLTFLSRERESSTFNEELKCVLLEMIDEECIETNYIPANVSNGEDYPVDYRLEGREGSSVFIYGVSSRDKARLTTIMLSHFLLNELLFESIIVFENQQRIPRRDVARLTNVAGPAVASLDATNDLYRKVKKLAAQSIPISGIFSSSHGFKKVMS